ncbi:MAG: NAD(P)/FAD-dependent oxidoreductase [Vicinamibacterales bacterium]
MAAPRVVIIGGGFAGLNAAKAFRGRPFDVIVLDRKNHHVFQPLLYQVAAAALSPSDIASPIRWILRSQDNVRVWLADVTAIDRSRRVVVVDGDPGEVPYDYLIVAAGVTHAYFGHDEWREHAPGLKTLEDALEIRARVLRAFELAEIETDQAERRRLLTFVVVGGGPTGVELAGALAEISRHALVNDFRSIDPETARVILIEGGAGVLQSYPEPLPAFARRALESLGVAVWTQSAVTGIDAGVVHVGDESIQAGTILWAAGVAASPLGRALGVEVDRAGRVPVTPELSIAGDERVYVVGDLALFTGTDGRPLPGVAQVAMQQGRHAARNITGQERGEPRAPFVYRFYGNMATIGRNKAIGDFGWLRLKGYPAWLIWLFIHVGQLIGFRNRLSVMLQWAVSYFTYQRAVRLITSSSRRS